MIDLKDIKVSTFLRRRKDMDVATITTQFVKVEHMPSGITVTKHSERSQVRAKADCIDELELLVELWEGA